LSSFPRKLDQREMRIFSTDQINDERGLRMKKIGLKMISFSHYSKGKNKAQKYEKIQSPPKQLL